MKKITKIFATCSLAALLFSSCNVDNIGPKYTSDSETDEVSFLQGTMVSNKLSSTATTFNVPLVRNNAESALTVAIASSVANEAVVCPASVTFAAGEYSTNLVLDITNLEVGTTYKTELSLSDEATYNKNTSVSKSTVTLKKVQAN